MRAIEVSLDSAIKAIYIFEDGRWGKYGIKQVGAQVYTLDESYYDREESEQNFEDFEKLLLKNNVEFSNIEIDEEEMEEMEV